jgi:hypothetical protein
MSKQIETMLRASQSIDEILHSLKRMTGFTRAELRDEVLGRHMETMEELLRTAQGWASTIIRDLRRITATQKRLDALPILDAIEESKTQHKELHLTYEPDKHTLLRRLSRYSTYTNNNRSETFVGYHDHDLGRRVIWVITMEKEKEIR